jgi:dUTP pyrophosphatase
VLVIKIKKLHPDAVLPVYAHGPNEDAGLDLRALEDVELVAGVPTMVRTGLAVELPPGFEMQIRPRSGLSAKHGITIPNSPGTIDPSYRGEVKVVLLWPGTAKNGKANHPGVQPQVLVDDEGKIVVKNRAVFQVLKGDRIAQAVVARYEAIEWEEGELSETERGEGGFGSTGTK